MFLKKPIVFKKSNRGSLVKELFNFIHTVLVAPHIHRHVIAIGDFSFGSILQKLLQKTGEGRKR